MLRVIVLTIVVVFSFPLYADDLMVHGGWIQEAPPVARSSAAYMVLMNHSDNEKTIIEVEAEGFANAMLHESSLQGDIAVMKHLESLAIPAGETVTLKPGGLHLMLMKPDKPLQVGDKVNVTLIFADQQRQVVTLEVKAGDNSRSVVDHSMHH